MVPRWASIEATRHEFDLEQLRPELAGDEQAITGSVVGDAVPLYQRDSSHEAFVHVPTRVNSRQLWCELMTQS
jgi:hypothetical protein